MSDPIVDQIGAAGDLAQIAQVPRISIQAFCETSRVAEVIESAAMDRRMLKAHMKVHMGGVAAAIEAGQIYVNEYYAGGVETPLGGYKNSGYGRELGTEGIDSYTVSQSISVAAPAN